MTIGSASAQPNAVASPPDVAGGDAAGPSAVSAADGGTARSSDRILLVDDNPRNLQMLLQFLGGRGHTLLVAKSGEAALEIAAKSRPAVILLDVMMPGIDGFETCRRLKADERTRDAAVLFLSAAGETEQKLSGFEAGGVDYITKPIQGEEVVARVNTHLTIRRLNVELQARMRQIERELALVQQMQRQLLPPTLPRIDTLELAAHYSTSRYAGGDYYDVVALPEGAPGSPPRRWGILVADVSGHGTPAAVTMAMTRTAFHACPELHADPAAVLRAINDHFEYLWEETGFVTAFYGVYDAPARVLRFASAGHPRPLLCRGGVSEGAGAGAVEELCCEATIPLMIGPLAAIESAEVTVRPGDRLLFYTDGIVERMNPAGDFYGPERLAECLKAARAGDAAETVRQIIESVEQFAVGRESADDQTLLIGAVM
jgi:serine phosphatase RsbU (regulator of sigma subunit)